MAQNVKILDTRRIPSGDPGRVGKLDWLVTYQLDTFRASVVTIAADHLTEDIIKEAVKKDIEDVTAWAGKELTL